jgi:hypothetical protein
VKIHTPVFNDDYASIGRDSYRADSSTKLTLRNRYGHVSEVTICLAQMGEEPLPDHVFIPNYGDCRGMVAALQDAGVIGTTRRIIETQQHTRDPLMKRPVHECPLLVSE